MISGVVCLGVFGAEPSPDLVRLRFGDELPCEVVEECAERHRVIEVRRGDTQDCIVVPAEVGSDGVVLLLSGGVSVEVLADSSPHRPLP